MIYIIIAIILILTINYVVKYINQKYREFVCKHSIHIKLIREINRKYIFNRVEPFNLTYNYDNEHFFNYISPKDYLTYQLIYKMNKVEEAMSDTIENQNLYDFYKEEIKKINTYGEFDTEVTLRNIKKLLDYERKIINEIIQRPIINFSIQVTLYQTNINGRLLSKKYQTFYIDEVEDIMIKLKNKSGNHYNDRDIWDSICRVERGKVSNKMRFAIFDRDHGRCRKCGRRDNLEVDHITPIAKGGKSTFDNLQTLCHRCNSMKSDNIEPRNEISEKSNTGYCPKCGAPLKLRAGKYGRFYGCMNYPKCSYTKKYEK